MIFVLSLLQSEINDVWQKPATSVVSRYVALLIKCRGPLAKCTCWWNSSSSNGVNTHMGCYTQRDEPLVCSAPGCQGAGWLPWRLWTRLGHLCDSDCHRALPLQLQCCRTWRDIQVQKMLPLLTWELASGQSLSCPCEELEAMLKQPQQLIRPSLSPV
jgi:hypothetical protein